MNAFKDLAQKRWPDAQKVAGFGPYAAVVACPGHDVTVLLWSDVNDALDAKLHLDALAADEQFGGTVTIHQMVKPGL